MDMNAERLERHRTVDAHTADLLERAAGGPASGHGLVDAGGQDEAPVRVSTIHCAARPCGKCGGYLYGREPWCMECARGNAAEYVPIYRAWIVENRDTHLAGAGVPPAFQSCSFDTFDVHLPEQRRAVEAVKQWADGDLRLGLFLHGPVGVGKTHLVVAALLELLARRFSVRYVTVRQLLLRCRESFVRNEPMSQILDRYLGACVLMLDDLSERSTEFSRETMELLIDRAYCDRRPRLVVTSNLDLAALGRRLDVRIPDRLRELCQVVKLAGVSHRRRIAAALG